MEKEEIIVDTPIEIAGMKIIPVAQVNTYCFSKRKNVSAYCSKKPLVVVIVTESGTKAFDMDGSQVKLDKLINAVPELNSLIT
jgi:uncharacterized spore protein YtfJ